MANLNGLHHPNLKYQILNPFTQIDEAQSIWESLQDKCDHSYFNSWGWISIWLKSLPQNTDLSLVALLSNNKPAAAFFLGRNSRKNHKIIPANTISLNSTANSYYDKLTIEYNSILQDSSLHSSPSEHFTFINTLKWDEFRIPGATSDLVNQLHLLDNPDTNLYFLLERSTHSFFVELQKIRDANMNYLGLLSSNKRSQIKRSIKQYELEGQILVREAETTEEALSMLEELASLHQKEWATRGESGAFSNQFFIDFHKKLIEYRFSHNEIQILHIHTQKQTIGYLYNFIYKKRVLFYQCGFNYREDNNYRPGLVSHYFAIMHNAQKNLSKYDFLAGDSAYKRSLSTGSEPMYWIRFFKKRYRYNLEKGLLKLSQFLKSREKNINETNS